MAGWQPALHSYPELTLNIEKWRVEHEAENSPCAFTPFATCPLPPPQNRLEVESKAGEKRYDQ